MTEMAVASLPPAPEDRLLARRADLATAALCAAFATAVMYHFYNRFWWAPDDGAYGYIAQRILRGDVLNRDINDIHAGYIHFINAAAMRLFGEDLVSMRYPLAFLTIAQSLIAYFLVLPKGRLAACAAAIAATCITFVQFLNPTANWYALAFAFILAGAFVWIRKDAAWRLFALGAICGCAICIRQLSGAFLAMATVAIVLCEDREPQEKISALARAVLGLIAAVLITYYIGKRDPAPLVLFGIWPLLWLALAMRDVAISDRRAIAKLAMLGLGGLAATIPLVLYHVWNGSVASWFDGAVLAAFRLQALDFIGLNSFFNLIRDAIRVAIALPAPTVIISIVIWLSLISTPVILGIVSIRESWRDVRRIGALTIIALFYAQVSGHYQTIIYLLHGSALSVVALLFVCQSARTRLLAMIVAALSLAALILQAGEPLSRGYWGVLIGAHRPLDNTLPLRSASLHIEADEADTYRAILALIDKNARPGEPILAAPFIPEFYFLSGHRSLLRGLILPVELNDAKHLAEAINAIDAAPPAVIVHKRQDKYNAPSVLALIAAAKKHYPAPQAIGDYDVYLRPRAAGQ